MNTSQTRPQLGPVGEQLVANLPSSVPNTQTAFAELYSDLVAQTPDLSIQAWNYLWETRGNLERSLALASRTLNSTQLDTVIRNERRERPLKAALSYNSLDDGQWYDVAQHVTSTNLIGRLFDEPTCPAGVHNTLVPRLDVFRLAWWHAGRDDLDDATAADLVLAMSGGKPEKRWNATLSDVARAMAHIRPGSIEVLARDRRTVVSVAGAWTLRPEHASQVAELLLNGSGGKTDQFAGMALVHNPVVDENLKVEFQTAWSAQFGHDEVVAANGRMHSVTITTCDEPTVDRLVSKCEPWEATPYAVGKPWHAVHLACSTASEWWDTTVFDGRRNRALQQVLVSQGAIRHCGYGIIAQARVNAWRKLGGNGPVADNREPWVGQAHSVATTGTPRPELRPWLLPPTLLATTLAELLGDNVPAWHVAVAVVDNHTGTVAELANVAQALA